MGCYRKAKSPDKRIQALTKKADVEYYHLVELGNIFIRYPDWSERYRRLLERAGELLTQGLNDLPEPFCLLCAEKRPEDCHRKLIGDYLVARGDDVEHIR